jgi:hypothetical protein
MRAVMGVPLGMERRGLSWTHCKKKIGPCAAVRIGGREGQKGSRKWLVERGWRITRYHIHNHPRQFLFLPPVNRRLPCFMRVAHPSAWFQKANKTNRPPEPDRLTAPPFYSTTTNKADPRPSSDVSSRSFVSSAHRSTPTLHTQDFPIHPFAAMAHAPLPVVSSHDSTEDEEDCPVCLEPLSFSFRLPGEKPHIVPECGHALHEVGRFYLSLPLATLWSV